MNSDLAKFLTNGGLTKFLAILFLFLLAVGALALAGIQLFNNRSIDPYAIAVIVGAWNTATTIIGIHVGTDLASKAP